MAILMKVIQVILALSILITIHEFGHFFFARIFGIKVDKFLKSLVFILYLLDCAFLEA